jgi:hypothetical protein
MHLWRLKSNPKTIVEKISDDLVAIVWSEHYDWGFGERFIYRWSPNNVIPLTPEECCAIVENRHTRQLPKNIGEIA